MMPKNHASQKIHVTLIDNVQDLDLVMLLCNM